MILHTYSDGGARGNPGPSATGVVITDERGQILEEATQILGETTNNQAEYRGMIQALETAKRRGGTDLISYSDSELMISQLTGKYRIKDEKLKVLADKVRMIVKEFASVEFRHVRRENTYIKRADQILNKALDQARMYGAPRSGGSPVQKEFL